MYFFYFLCLLFIRVFFIRSVRCRVFEIRCKSHVESDISSSLIKICKYEETFVIWWITFIGVVKDINPQTKDRQ